MEDSLFDKILNGDISLTVHGQEPETNTQAQGRPSSDISEKAIGGRLGRRGGLGGLIGGGLLRPPDGMVFVDITGAIDGDEDGIVFEGTPFKRPIIPRAVVPKNIGLTQQDGALANAMKREEKRRGDSKPKRRRMSDRDVVDLYEQREGRGQSRAMTAGSRSRTDRYPVAKTTVEDIIKDLGLTGDDAEAARKILYSNLVPVSPEHLREIRQHDSQDDIGSQIESLSPDESLSEIGRELALSLAIHIASNGIPVISADPHPIFNSIIPDGRDWRYVEAPAADVIKRLLEMSRDFTPLDSSQSPEYMLARDIDKIEKSLIAIIEAALDSFGASRNGKKDRGIQSFAQYYLHGIENPRDALYNLFESIGTDGIHDVIGHLGTGRGFDRHGEWANVLAMISVILDHPDLDMTPEERERTARWWLEGYGPTHLLRQLVADTDEDSPVPYGTLDDIKKLIRRWPGTVRELLDELGTGNDPERQQVSGSKSSTRVLMTEAPDGKFNLAQLEQNVSRQEFVAEGSRSRTDRYRLIDREAEEIYDDLELTDSEKVAIRQALSQGLLTVQTLYDMVKNGELPEYVHPGLTRQQVIDILESIELSVSSNGVPVITFMGMPYMQELLPKDRDWSLVEAPSVDELDRIGRIFDSNHVSEWTEEQIAAQRLALQISQTILGGGDSGSSLIEHKLWDVIDSLRSDADGADLEEFWVQLFTNFPVNDSADREDRKTIGDILTLVTSDKASRSFLDVIMRGILGGMTKSASHDFGEHMTTGRGFDRHGEWATFIFALRVADGGVRHAARVLGITDEEVIEFARKNIIASLLNIGSDTIFNLQNKTHKDNLEKLLHSLYPDNDRTKYIDFDSIIRNGIESHFVSNGLVQDNDRETRKNIDAAARIASDAIINNGLVLSMPGDMTVDLIERILKDKQFIDNILPLLSERLTGMLSYEQNDEIRDGLLDIVNRVTRSIIKERKPDILDNRETAALFNGIGNEDSPYDVTGTSISDSRLSADEIIQLLDPRDENGVPLNGSKSSTKISKPIGEMDLDDISAVVDETQLHHLPDADEIDPNRKKIGRKLIGLIDADIISSDDPTGALIERMINELGLDPKKVQVARAQLDSAITAITEILNNESGLKFHVSMPEETVRMILQSFSVGIASDGLPYIVFAPDPRVSDVIPDKRNWRNVEIPSIDQIIEFFEFIKNARESVPEEILRLNDLWASGEVSSAEEDKISYLRRLQSLGDVAYDLKEEVLAMLNRLYKSANMYDGEYTEQSLVDQKIFEQFAERTGIRTAQGTNGSIVYTVLKSLFLPYTGIFRTGNPHDPIEHMGTGRGFDRHGEWAAFLVQLSLWRSSEVFKNMTPEQKQYALHHIFVDGNIMRLIQAQIDSANSQTSDSDVDRKRLLKEISNLFWDIFDNRNDPTKHLGVDWDRAIEILDPRDGNGQPINGSKSSTRTFSPLAETTRGTRSLIAAQEMGHQDFINETNKRNGNFVFEKNLVDFNGPFTNSPFKRELVNINKNIRSNSASISGSKSTTRVPVVRKRTTSDISRGRGDLVIERVQDLLRARRNARDQIDFIEPLLSDTESSMWERNDNRYSQLEDIVYGIDIELEEIMRSIDEIVANHRAADISRAASSRARQILKDLSRRLRDQFDFDDDDLQEIDNLISANSDEIRSILNLAPSTRSMEAIINTINDLLKDDYNVNAPEEEFYDEDNDDHRRLFDASAYAMFNHAVALVARRKGIDNISGTVIDVDSREIEESPIAQIPGSQSTTSRVLGSRSQTPREDIEKYLLNDLSQDDTIFNMSEKFNTPPEILNNIILRMGGLQALRRNAGIPKGFSGSPKLAGTVELERYILDGIAAEDTAMSLAKRFGIPLNRAQSIITRMGGIRKLRKERGLIRTTKLDDPPMQRLEEHALNAIRDTDTIDSLAKEFGISPGRVGYRINLLGGLRKLKLKNRQRNSRVSSIDGSKSSTKKFTGVLDARPGVSYDSDKHNIYVTEFDDLPGLLVYDVRSDTDANENIATIGKFTSPKTGREYTISGDPYYAEASAYVPGIRKRIGYIGVYPDRRGNNKHEIAEINVEREYRREGLATALLAVINKTIGGEIFHSDILSEDGEAWAERGGKSKFNADSGSKSSTNLPKLVPGSEGKMKREPRIGMAKTPKETLDEIDQYLSNSLEENDTVKSIAEKFGLSHFVVNERAKKLGGMSKLRSQRGFTKDAKYLRKASMEKRKEIENYLLNEVQTEDTIASLAERFGVSKGVVIGIAKMHGGMEKLQKDKRGQTYLEARKAALRSTPEAEARLIQHLGSGLRQSDSFSSLSKEFDIPINVVMSLVSGLGGLSRLKYLAKKEINNS